MTQTLTAPQTAAEDTSLSHTPDSTGQQPVMDVEAFLARLPKFTDTEVNELEAVILEDRVQRRSTAGVVI